MSDLFLSYHDMRSALAGVFEANSCSAAVAATLAANCAAAERDGSHSHGLFRMAGYVSTLRSGWVDGRAEPAVEDAAPGFVRVDARNGFTLPAHAKARARVIEKALANGVAVLAIRDSHHLGALHLDVEPYAEEGLVALSVINSMAVVAHPGSARPVYGTNPVAFAAPREGAPPVVFDFATSTMAHGDVRLHAREGRPVPQGVGVDAQGRATTDPNAILEGGALLPFGAHKGAALALMVEILCAALVGGRFSMEVDWSGHPGAQTPRTGQTLVVIDPSAGSQGLAPFAGRVDHLVRAIRAEEGVRLPGERRLTARREAAERGIRVDGDAWRDVLALAGR